MGAFKGKGGGALATGTGAGSPTAAGSPAAADLAKAKGVDLETQRKLQHDLGMQSSSDDYYDVGVFSKQNTLFARRCNCVACDSGIFSSWAEHGFAAATRQSGSRGGLGFGI